MALETVVFQQDPFSYGSKDFNVYGLDNSIDHVFSRYFWNSPPSSVKEWENNSSSPEVCTFDGVPAEEYPPVGTLFSAPGRRKRRRTKGFKNKEEMENQRMTHIAVERNRRKQMNDYLAVLRSLMPPSYAQRGDQASIVGGAINFVKELEQLQQFLEAHKLVKQRSYSGHSSPLFANFFTFPQYSTHPNRHADPLMAGHDSVAEKPSTVADVEVSMVESHANIKVVSRKQPKQLLKMVAGLYSLGLSILHLNVTTVDHRVLYSFSVKVEDDCQLSTVNEIATTVHEMVGKIQMEAMAS
ncbi:hypothetical protein NMG60_11007417 [Bertholletia excelsa]